MMASKIPWIGTSWKMNKLRAEARSYAETLEGIAVANTRVARLFVIPPFPYIAEVAAILQARASRSAPRTCIGKTRAPGPAKSPLRW